MTKFSYSEVQGAYTSSQNARVACLANFSTVEETLSQFTTSTSLTGPGWSSVKEALSPYSVVSKSLYNYHCDFGEAYIAFLNSFEAEVGETTKVLDTDELTDLQNKINRIQQEKQELLLKIAGNIAFEIVGGYGVMFKDFQINQEQKKVDLLEKYQAFEEAHAADFSEIVSIGTQLTTAMSELGQSKQFNAKTGVYTVTSCTGKEWYTKLSEYNDSCPEHRVEIVVENPEAAKHGVYIYKVYTDGKYSKRASDNLMYTTSVEGAKALGLSTLHMGGELSSIYDIYRLFTGKDPVTGAKADQLEAGLWAMLFLLPAAKFVEGVKSLRAGDKLLKGADLTADELRILTEAGYFKDVEKIEKVSGAKIPDVEIKKPLGKNIKKHISKHDYESFKKQADYLTDSQLAQKLEKNSFFNPEWSTSDMNKYVEIAYNDLLAQGKTGKHVYEIAGEKITVVINNDGILDTAFGSHKLTVNDFRK